MTIKELLDILNTIPKEVLTCGNVEYTIKETSYVRNRVDINFFLKGSLTCFIRVFGDNTIQLAYLEDAEEKPRFKDCFTAMRQTKVYLELLGFKNDR